MQLSRRLRGRGGRPTGCGGLALFRDCVHLRRSAWRDGKDADRRKQPHPRRCYAPPDANPESDFPSRHVLFSAEIHPLLSTEDENPFRSADSASPARPIFSAQLSQPRHAKLNLLRHPLMRVPDGAPLSARKSPEARASGRPGSALNRTSGVNRTTPHHISGSVPP